MKITLTGSLGNISKPLTEKLIAAGHEVTLISSDAGKAEAIRALGATPAIGSVDDAAFLEKTFTGADAVYTMVPPNFGATDYREYISSIGQKFAQAIRKSGVKKVVNLSSIGAHLADGTGPIKGLHDVEEIFAGLENVSVKHLRAGFFYVNFFNNIDMIRHMNILGANYGADNTLVMVHPKDIADAAAKELQKEFTGKSVMYVTSDERTLAEITAVLGAAIGKPELKWVQFSDEEALAGMLQAGLSEVMAKIYTEMGTAVRTGVLFEDYRLHTPNTAGTVKLEDFASEFAEKFRS